LTLKKGTNVRFLPRCTASRTPNLEFAAVHIRVIGAADTGVGDGRKSTGAWLGLKEINHVARAAREVASVGKSAFRVTLRTLASRRPKGTSPTRVAQRAVEVSEGARTLNRVDGAVAGGQTTQEGSDCRAELGDVVGVVVDHGADPWQVAVGVKAHDDACVRVCVC